MKTIAMRALAAVAFMAGNAWAADGFDPPTADVGLNWVALGIAAGALIATGVVAFKNANRTHLD